MRAAVAALIALGAGCSETTATQLVVVVATDLDEGEIDGYRIEVRGPNGAVVDDRSFEVADDPLPASFGVAPRDGDASRRVTVEATALLGGEELFSTRAVTGYVPDRRSLLYLFLAERCQAETCRPEETCGRAGCMSPEIDPRDLPPWGGIPDAAVPVPDAAPDAGPEAGTGEPPFSPMWLARGEYARVASIKAIGDSLFVVGQCGAPCAVLDDPPIGAAGQSLTWMVRLDGGAVSWGTVLPAESGSVPRAAEIDPDGVTLWVVGDVSAGSICLLDADSVSSAFAVAVDRDGGTCEGGVVVGGSGQVSFVTVVATDAGPLVGGTAGADFSVGGATIDAVPGTTAPFVLGLDRRALSGPPWKIYDWVATASASFERAALGSMFYVSGTSVGTLTLGSVSYQDPHEAFVWSGSLVPGDDAPTSVARIASDDGLSASKIALRPDGSLAWLVAGAGDVSMDDGKVQEGLGLGDFLVGIVATDNPRLAVVGSDSNELAADLCVLDDRIVTVGSVLSEAQIGEFTVGILETYSALVLTLDDRLDLLDAHSFGGPGVVVADAVHCDAARQQVWIAGNAQGDLIGGVPAPLVLDGHPWGAFLLREDVR